jgi:hypothetical protein
MSYPASARLFPDLQKYFSKYLKTNQLDRYEVSIPSDIHIEHFYNCRSFIRLLFDDDWHFPNYTHCYKNIEDWGSWPQSIRDRILIYPHAQYYLPCCDSTNFNLLYEVCDSTSSEFLNDINHLNTQCCDDSTAAENIFQLQNDDFVLLNALNIFRCDSTALEIINQVSNIPPSLFQMPGSTTWILNVDFDFLSTNLSKLIFIFLNLKINLDFTFYIWENGNFLSNNLFEHLYEIYVIDNVFQYMVSIGPDYVEN